MVWMDGENLDGRMVLVDGREEGRMCEFVDLMCVCFPF